MGLRGPAPKPSAVRKAEGNPGHKAINRHEPEPPAGEPEMPDYLDAGARVEWRRLVPILREMKVLTVADYMALGQLCQLASTKAAIEKRIKREGILVTAPNKIKYLNPLLKVQRSTNEQLAKMQIQFGLTPSARTRIQVVGQTSGETAASAIKELEKVLAKPRVLRFKSKSA